MLRPVVAAVLLGFVCLPLAALAQQAGSRAGQGDVARIGDLPSFPAEVAAGVIAIDGRATLQVPPTEIRIVLAVTGEGRTAQECQKTVDGTIAKLREVWQKELKIPADRSVVDFIAILPRYEWKLEKRGDTDVGVEQLVGYRMQTNVHLAVGDDAAAQAALLRAFALNVTDIIAFDYWSKELDAFKLKAREAALKAARGKAEVLLAPIFEKTPRAINVQEHTTVRYPESLYQSFTSGYEEAVTLPTRRDIPFIRAIRPRNTYYRGLTTDSDLQPAELPMKPEISVVSTVRLYYQSPAAEAAKKAEKKPRRAGKG